MNLIVTFLLDLIENRAQQEELQRAFSFVKGNHYYKRMTQLREEELKIKEKLAEISDIELPLSGVQQWLIDRFAV